MSKVQKLKITGLLFLTLVSVARGAVLYPSGITGNVVTTTNLDHLVVKGATTFPVANGDYYISYDTAASNKTTLVWTNKVGSTTNLLYWDNPATGLWAIGTNKFDAGAQEGVLYFWNSIGPSNSISPVLGSTLWVLNDAITPEASVILSAATTTTINNPVLTTSSQRFLNVADYGAPTCYYPGIGTTWTGGPPCDQYVQNAINAAIAKNIDTIYFPPGVYHFKFPIIMPSINSGNNSGVRSIIGTGVLHNSRTGNDTQDAKPFTLLWFDNTNNGQAFISGNADVGKLVFKDFEIGGCTNPVLGGGAGNPNLQGVTNSAFADTGFMISHAVSGFSGGDIYMDNVCIAGFRVGMNYFGNSSLFNMVQFSCNDIGFVHTNQLGNDYNVDQLVFQNCSVGHRNGGVGYYLHNVHDCVFINPSDFFIYTWAILDQCNITIIGGNTEFDNVSQPVWSIHRASATSFYPTNKWDFGNTGSFNIGTNVAIICNGNPSFIDVHGWRCRAGTTNYVAIDATGAPGTVFSGQNFMFQTDGTGSVTTNRTGTVDNWHLGMFGVSPAFCPTNPLAFWPTRPLTPGGSCIVNSNGTMYGLKAAPAGTLWVSTNIIF